MKAQKSPKPIAGITAPAVRPTPLGAALLAGAFALPVGIITQAIELLFF